MDRVVIYIHGKGGNASEASHYIPLFENCDVLGFDYKAQTPWEAKEEFSIFFDSVFNKYSNVDLIANSIGAFFAMSALPDYNFEKIFFISPVVDMKKLIENMMIYESVSEDELCSKKVIKTAFGEDLSWDYLCYVRSHPVRWKIPTHILYAGKDNLTSYETISEFAEKTNSALTVMDNAEHWFHTDEQMLFFDNWIKSANCKSEK